jgi:serine/threonine-protein kinase
MRFNRAPTGDLEEQMRLACDELRRRLRAGEVCRAEDFLDSHPSFSADPNLAVPLIHAEWSVRIERGERPALREWLDRFPQWRDRLESYFHLGASQYTGSTVSAAAEASKQLPTKSAAESAPLTELIDIPLPPHDVGDVIGRGSMGVVFRAFDKVLKRPVALKKISHKLAENPTAIARFFQEARAAAGLHHPHIVAVYGLGQFEGQHCFTMPLVPCNLDQRRERFAEPRAAAELIRKIAEAVHAAHQHGIVHRDLKPGNILLDERDEPLVADFGLAVLLHDPANAARQREGTPAYMAPEQTAHGEGAVGPPADVWALGVMLYQLLAGQRPFNAPTPDELGDVIRCAAPPSLRRLRSGLDPRLEVIVAKCLAKQPDQRYATAQALADDLAAWRDDRPGVAWQDSWGRRLLRFGRRPSTLGSAALAALLVALAALLMPAIKPPDDRDAREVERLQRLLAKGHEAKWKIEEGKLPRLKPLLGQSTIGAADDEPNVLQITTWDDTALVELLPEVKRDHFVIRAQVATQAALHGQAGLYLAHSRTGEEQSFITVSVADQGAFRGTSLGAFHYHGGYDDSHSSFETSFPPLAGGEFHLLEIEVGPGKITVQRDGRVDGVFSPEVRTDAANVLAARHSAAPSFPPRGGVGLYLSHCIVRFKDIAIQPLP